MITSGVITPTVGAAPGAQQPAAPSRQSLTPFPLVSTSATPQPQSPGDILFGSAGQPSLASATPSPSSSQPRAKGYAEPGLVLPEWSSPSAPTTAVSPETATD